LTGINNAKIIDSSYNASKSAVIAFLEMMRELKKQTKRPIAFVFGDMRELGDEAKIEHEAVAQKLRGIVDYLYLVGPLTREFVLPHVDLHTTDVALNDSDESKKKENNTTIKQNNNSELKEVRWFANAKYAGEYLKDNLPKNSLVLVKGSQNTIFLEETIKYILANKDDVKKLTRQSSFWMKTKNTTLSLRS
jgi:UDP-N-acetylmuramyl pentapeptide synthase